MSNKRSWCTSRCWGNMGN